MINTGYYLVLLICITLIVAGIVLIILSGKNVISDYGNQVVASIIGVLLIVLAAIILYFFGKYYSRYL